MNRNSEKDRLILSPEIPEQLESPGFGTTGTCIQFIISSCCDEDGGVDEGTSNTTDVVCKIDDHR